MYILKKILEKWLNKIIYLIYKSSIIIGKYQYRWCFIPVPKGYPRQSQTHPAIIYIHPAWNNATHWLASTPYPDADIRYENPCLYFANSSPLDVPMTFSPIAENPILEWPGGCSYNSDPELYFEEDILYMIIRENENDRFIREIKVMHSENGWNWTSPIHLCGSNDENRQLLSPSIIKKDNDLFLYFLNGDAGIRKQGKCEGIEIFRGTNLKNPDFSLWKKGMFLNKDELGIEAWHFDLFVYESKLYMIFCGRDIKHRTLRSTMETYMAVSYDFINFRIFKKPIIKYVKTYRPTAYLDNGVLNLYFSVVGNVVKDGSDRSIGVTSIPMKNLLEMLNSDSILAQTP